MGVDATLKVSLRVNETGAPTAGATTFSDTMEAGLTFASGTGAGQIDLVYVTEQTLAAGANLDLDLAGVLTKMLGGTLTAAELVGILIINAPSSGVPGTAVLTLGGGTNPVVGYMGGTTPTLGPIRPGGVRLLAETDAAGLCGVTAATADILRIAASGSGSATFQLALLARTVA